MIKPSHTTTSENEKTELYTLGKLPFDSLDSLRESFENLPADPYADDRLRSRRYSRFQYALDKSLTRAQHIEFVQSSDINDYNGDVERKYEEIEDSTMQNPVFLKMFDEFKAVTGLSDSSIIECHQIRWHCRARVKLPAPEGTHQDGFDFIAMFMVDPNNVDGGEIMVYETPDTPPKFKKALEPGEYVAMNDKLLYHNASPLVPTANEDDGHWDLIVLTAHQVN